MDEEVSCNTVECMIHGVQAPAKFELQGYETKNLCPLCMIRLIEWLHDEWGKLGRT